MKPETLTIILISAVTEGVQLALQQSSPISESLTPAAAYRLYGRSNVERWLQEGLIRFLPYPGDSPKKFLDSRQLEAVAAASNRCTYLPVAER